MLPAGLLPVTPWVWAGMAGLLSPSLALMGPWLYRRSRLVGPDALKLPNDEPGLFLGRDDDVERLTACCRDNPLTCLVGESGVGKSAIVRLGLLRHWPDAGRMTPLVIDPGRQDWVEGPREALAEALERAGRPTGRLLIVFDQLDDYQIRHRRHFLEDGVAVWKGVDAILAENPFWADLAALIRSGRVHALFVTRSDASIGLDSLKVVRPTRNYELGRLPSEYVADLLDRLTDKGAVQDPGYGWSRLKARLAHDLTVDGLVLPVQMTVTLRALRYLRTLTVAEYERAGGLRGLRAMAIMRQVAEVATAARLDKPRVLGLVVALVDRQTMRSTPRTTGELIGAGADTVAVVRGAGNVPRPRAHPDNCHRRDRCRGLGAGS